MWEDDLEGTQRLSAALCSGLASLMETEASWCLTSIISELLGHVLPRCGHSFVTSVLTVFLSAQGCGAHVDSVSIRLFQRCHLLAGRALRIPAKLCVGCDELSGRLVLGCRPLLIAASGGRQTPAALLVSLCTHRRGACLASDCGRGRRTPCEAPTFLGRCGHSDAVVADGDDEDRCRSVSDGRILWRRFIAFLFPWLVLNDADGCYAGHEGRQGRGQVSVPSCLNGSWKCCVDERLIQFVYTIATRRDR